MQLFWHRRDLRAADNRGLAAAADATGDRGPVVPVFIFDDGVLEHAGPPRVAFLLDALASLRAWYRGRGGDLLVRRGDPAAVLPALAAGVGADLVRWNEDYSGLARRRDAAVRRALNDAGVDRASHRDAVLHHPDSIRTNAGDPYAVYTYYWRKWRDRQKAAPIPAPDAADLADVGRIAPDSGEVPEAGALGFDDPVAEVPTAGPDAARDLLAAFCGGPIHEYDDAREYPARDATSRLSPHLKFGTVGVREVWAATVGARDGADGEADESAREFQSQLAWREFYTQVLYHNPAVVTDDYRSYEHPIEWREDPEALQAWKDGETGYPIVDAGMRQLRAEAWMHNRVRMIVASFLTKDLLLDWRKGYAWFREKLVDHDTANDSGGWQWAASTGTDAQPYFRIFNPATQGERYDPDAEYIREYVPELRGVGADDIHAWHELDGHEREELAPGYPDPVVDHAARREEALAMFEAARGEEG